MDRNRSKEKLLLLYRRTNKSSRSHGLCPSSLLLSAF